MVRDDVELLLKYPLITTKIGNHDKHYYTGRIMCGNQEINIRIIEQKCKFKMKANELSKEINNVEASNIVEYLDKIKTILESKNSHKITNFADLYRKVIQDYSEFKTFHLTVKKSSLSADLSSINITTIDEGGRELNLEVSVDFNETSKEIFRPKNLNLPETSLKNFKEKFSTLTDVYSKFLAEVESLQPFFDLMDHLDASCCVLDPEKPTRKDCYRRIWLDQNLSLMVTVDPFNVKSRPDLRFLGPERVVDEYFQKINDKLDDWDEKMDVLEGLLDILGFEKFPTRPTTDQEVLIQEGECSICFASRYEDKLPEIICSNRSCENFYHIHCLSEWLTSLNSKRFFNQLVGKCPNCEKEISCPIPETDVDINK